jgi:hypothetical protein
VGGGVIFTRPYLFNSRFTIQNKQGRMRMTSPPMVSPRAQPVPVHRPLQLPDDVLLPPRRARGGSRGAGPNEPQDSAQRFG